MPVSAPTNTNASSPHAAAPETRDKIFEPFYTTGRSKGATGLGMAIVHNLMTSALAGTVEVTSREGAGTAVTLTFPKSVPARAD